MLIALSSLATPGLAAETSRPNIIFIITDDQKNDQLGYLEGKALTPNLDRMAADGVEFRKNYVASSVCSPSRYTCLTGQYASRCSIPYFTDQASDEGVRRVLWNVGFAPNQPTLPRVLQAHGYRTGFVGKWHINGVGKRVELPPPGSDASDPEIAEKLRFNHDSICEDIRNFGFDWADAAYRGNLHDDKLLRATGMDEHNMEWLTDAALRFIEESKDEPFFLYFATTLNHSPDPNHSLKHADPRVSGEGLLGEPIAGVMPARETIYARLKAADVPEEYAMALWLDDGIGAVLDKVAALGLENDTLIVYFNDHGMSDQSKGTAYEGGLISPTLAYWPGRLKPQAVTALTQNTDFAPTFLDVAGITPPADMKIDGKSWLPLVDGKVDHTHTSVYSEIGLVRSVSTPEWKYIAFRVPPSFQRTKEERLAEHTTALAELHAREAWTANNPRYALDPDARYHQMGMGAGGSRFERGQLNPDAAWYDNYFDPDQLYQLSVDPKESHNLADDPAHADDLTRMQQELKQYLEDIPGTFEDLLNAETVMH